MLRRPQFDGRIAVPAAATGLALALQLAALRLVVRADAAQAYLFGRPLRAACAVRARFGIPCPSCGITRGIGLALHGHVAQSLLVFPAAPFAILGVAALSVALVAIALTEWSAGATRAQRLASAVRSASLSYAAAVGLVWLGGWALRL